MKAIQQVCEKITELTLLLILLILPFSYDMVNTKQILFLSGAISLCIFLYISKGTGIKNQGIGEIFFAILFMFLFNYAEQVNFIRQFNIPVEITWRIPLSTVLLSIGMLAFLIKAWTEKKIKLIGHPFAWYFLAACGFLVLLMILFYPVLYFRYQMQAGPDILLLNKILKYLMISLLITDYLSDAKKMRRMDLAFMAGLSITIILRIVI